MAFPQKNRFERINDFYKSDDWWATSDDVPPPVKTPTVQPPSPDADALGQAINEAKKSFQSIHPGYVSLPGNAPLAPSSRTTEPSQNERMPDANEKIVEARIQGIFFGIIIGIALVLATQRLIRESKEAEKVRLLQIENILKGIENKPKANTSTEDIRTPDSKKTPTNEPASPSSVSSKGSMNGWIGGYLTGGSAGS